MTHSITTEFNIISCWNRTRNKTYSFNRSSLSFMIGIPSRVNSLIIVCCCHFSFNSEMVSKAKKALPFVLYRMNWLFFFLSLVLIKFENMHGTNTRKKQKKKKTNNKDEYLQDKQQQNARIIIELYTEKDKNRKCLFSFGRECSMTTISITFEIHSIRLISNRTDLTKLFIYIYMYMKIFRNERINLYCSLWYPMMLLLLMNYSHWLVELIQLISLYQLLLNRAKLVRLPG